MVISDKTEKYTHAKGFLGAVSITVRKVKLIE